MDDNGVVPAPGGRCFGASTVSVRHNDDHYPVAPVASNDMHPVGISREQTSGGQAAMTEGDLEQSVGLTPSPPSRMALTTTAHMTTAFPAPVVCPLSPELASTATETTGRSNAAASRTVKSLSGDTCGTLEAGNTWKSSLKVDAGMTGDTFHQHHQLEPAGSPEEVRRSSSSGDKRLRGSADSLIGMIGAPSKEKSQDAVSDSALDARLMYVKGPDGPKDTTSGDRRRVRGCKQSSAALVGEPYALQCNRDSIIGKKLSMSS